MVMEMLGNICTVSDNYIICGYIDNYTSSSHNLTVYLYNPYTDSSANQIFTASSINSTSIFSDISADDTHLYIHIGSPVNKLIKYDKSTGSKVYTTSCSLSLAGGNDSQASDLDYIIIGTKFIDKATGSNQYNYEINILDSNDESLFTRKGEGIIYKKNNKYFISFATGILYIGNIKNIIDKDSTTKTVNFTCEKCYHFCMITGKDDRGNISYASYSPIIKPSTLTLNNDDSITISYSLSSLPISMTYTLKEYIFSDPENYEYVIINSHDTTNTYDSANMVLKKNL